MPIALVPAAGASRRMGRPKLLLPYAGGTVLGATVAALRAGGCDRVLLVTAPGDAPLARFAGTSGCLLAVNPTPERGMLSTLWAGLAALGAGGSPLLVAPGDLPRLAPATVAAVVAALDDGAALAWPRCAGRNGHPLGIAARLVGEIATLDPAVGLRQLRDRHAATSRTVDVDDRGCVDDVDTPEDYAALAPA